jgi:RNA recognition motif-containing protein
VDMHFNDPSRDVFVSNLPESLLVEADLRRLCARYGRTLYVHLVRERGGARARAEGSRGFGLARYVLASDAARAVKGLDGLVLDGRVLRAAPVRLDLSPRVKKPRLWT